MKLEDIFISWKEDCSIDQSELGIESLRVPELHHKYFKILTHERLSLKKVEQQYKTLYKAKYDYFMGHMDDESLQNLGWDPQPLKILKQDLPLYMDSDPDLAVFTEKIDVQKEKIELLESIIKMISTRGFQIKNAIDWERFKNGM